MQSAEVLDLDKSILRSAVRGMEKGLLVAGLVAGLAVGFTDAMDWRRYVGTALVLATVAVSRWQSRQSLRRAAMAIVVGIWCTTALAAVLLSGIHSTSNIIFPFSIALAGWVLGRRWLIGTTVATIAAMLGLAAAETLGWMHPTPRANPITVGIQEAAIFAVMAYMAWSARRALGDSRDQAVVIARELTLQNRVLALSREETQRLIENMPAAVASFDALSNLIRCNTRYAQLFAATPEEIVGKNLSEYVPQVVLDQRETQWAAALQGEPQSYRRFNVHPVTQDLTWVDVGVMPVFRDEAVIGMDVVLVDVTDKVKAEAEIRALNSDLEHRVEERTQELAQAMEHLQTSREDLVRSQAQASLAALVASVSHELGTPIGNSVLVAGTFKDLAERLKSHLGEGVVRKSTLTSLQQSMDDGADMLNTNLQRAEKLLRSFKQVSADQASEQRREFDLRNVITEVVASMAPSLRRSPHVIDLDIPAGITMDSLPGPLGQVLINLINNAHLHAFEQMESGGRVAISAQVDGEQVILTVADNGAGMTADVQAQLFTPFYSTKIGKGGTGLGMSIVDTIVRNALGGSLTTTSEVGKGSCFEMRLPLSLPTIISA
jgi:PAS domain S-box-containing protein